MNGTLLGAALAAFTLALLVSALAMPAAASLGRRSAAAFDWRGVTQGQAICPLIMGRPGRVVTNPAPAYGIVPDY